MKFNIELERYPGLHYSQIVRLLASDRKIEGEGDRGIEELIRGRQPDDQERERWFG
jgi:hypothetical protein